RLNVWVSIALFVLAAAYFVWQGRRHPGREEQVYVEGREPAASDEAPAEGDGTDVTDESDVAEEAQEADEVPGKAGGDSST
ncbi:MAG: prolipoprotein diacylglyceryl transferase, partial [Actinomycetota bacterium]|nr:prolipoprotein diacylglyceryl transferase [Actinomycetota bacterium]